jgi:hypothetical protein
MKPWSLASRGAVPPAATALATSVSTCSRPSQLRQTQPPMLVLASAMGLLVKVAKNSRTINIAYRLLPSMSEAPWSPVKSGSNE